MFHLLGQHIDANERFPHNKQFDKFHKNDIKRNEPWMTDEKKQDIAIYDNATFYNDFIINKILSHYQNKNAILIYYSDHSEEIYDFRDNKGRKGNYKNITEQKGILKYQYDIPFFIWVSDKYKRKNPHIIKEIKKSIKKAGMTDNVCQILFHLADLRKGNKYYKKERDILSDSYKIKKRIINGNINYDQLMQQTK